MRRALRLAQRGFAPPNPMVGCVIVRNGEPVGEGYHPKAGEPHAEVFALRAAGEKARSATAYVTLEPCCHFGRTPPCSRALIAAGVKRVVVAMVDPNPKVAGKGLEELRQVGIAVTVGVLEEQARRVNEAFIHFHTHGTPFVTLKAAMTLDGKIATHTSDSRWITGPRARQEVHRIRAQSGAVMVGIGTLLADDAELTARLPDPGAPRQPLRVIVDSRLRTPLDCRAVKVANEECPLLIATTSRAPAQAEAALVRPGVEIARLPAGSEGHVDLKALMSLLAERSIISVLVEGGGILHAAMLEAGLYHKALLFYAPKIVGGRDAPTSVEGKGLAHMGDAWMLRDLQVRRLGGDLAVEGYFA